MDLPSLVCDASIRDWSTLLPGLSVIDDFVTPEEALVLEVAVSEQPWRQV